MLMQNSHQLKIFRDRDYVFMLRHRLNTAIGKNTLQCLVFSFQLKEDLEDSRCQIKLVGPETAIYKGPVISAEILPSEAEKEGRGFIISSHLFKRILDGGKFSAVVKILNP